MTSSTSNTPTSWLQSNAQAKNVRGIDQRIIAESFGFGKAAKTYVILQEGRIKTAVVTRATHMFKIRKSSRYLFSESKL